MENPTPPTTHNPQTTRRPISEDERAMIRKFALVSVGRSDGIRGFQKSAMEFDKVGITEPQAQYLRQCIVRFRRQVLDDALVNKAKSEIGTPEEVAKRKAFWDECEKRDRERMNPGGEVSA